VTYISVLIFVTKLLFVIVLENDSFATVGNETRCMKQRLTTYFSISVTLLLEHFS